MTKFLALLLGFGVLFTEIPQLHAQQNPLPRGLTDAERALLQDYTPPVVADPSAQPGSAGEDGPRAMAEWEELQAVVITWTSFPAILAEIVRAVQKECRVIIICTNESSVQTYLTNLGIDWTKNVSFLVGGFNSIWIRDYGPNPVYRHAVDSLILVDWIYNRPRPKDDLVPALVGQFMDIPVVSTNSAPNDLVHTGGNFMSDGLGTGFSSKLVLDENGPNNTYGFSNHSEAEVDEIMYDFMGISPYIKMVSLPFDLIHHIDMHMKLVDEETLIVGQYPDGIADGPQIEANLQYVLNSFTTSFGTPFRVIRMPMPPALNGKYPDQNGDYRTYTNALIANRTVIVPIYDEKYDSTALRIWHEAMPGYTVTGIDCNAIIPLAGALHCITKEIGVGDPLRIVHHRLDGSGSTPDGYLVDALVQHRTGIVSAILHYTTDTLAGYISVPMVPTGEVDHFSAYIPVLSEGTDVFYYITAEANSGKTGQRPLTAPSGYWHFSVPESTGITERTVGYRIMGNAFPNPASAITCIPIDPELALTGYRLELIDALGRRIPLPPTVATMGRTGVFLNASLLAQGLYTLCLTDGFHQEVQTLVIVHP